MNKNDIQNLHPLLLPALARYDAFNMHYFHADFPDETYSVFDDDYIRHINLKSDIQLDDFNRQLLAQILLDDEIGEIHLLIAYYSYDDSPLERYITHLTVIADTTLSNIPLEGDFA